MFRTTVLEAISTILESVISKLEQGEKVYFPKVTSQYMVKLLRGGPNVPAPLAPAYVLACGIKENPDFESYKKIQDLANRILEFQDSYPVSVWREEENAHFLQWNPSTKKHE